MPSWATAVLAIGGFVLFACLLAFVRMRSDGKFTVETREITAAVVAVGIGLFLFGEFDEIAYGDFRLVRKISEEAQTPVSDRISASPTTLNFKPIDQAARKSSASAIDEYLRRGVEALTFELGKQDYYVPDIVAQYFRRLTQAPYLKYVVFYRPDRKMLAVADARAIAAYFRTPGSEITPQSFTDWIEKPDIEKLKSLPGYVEPVNKTSSTREALNKMLQFSADYVPVTDDTGRFLGVARSSQLIGTLVGALASAERR